jgi:hypothetical protein
MNVAFGTDLPYRAWRTDCPGELREFQIDSLKVYELKKGNEAGRLAIWTCTPYRQ